MAESKGKIAKMIKLEEKIKEVSDKQNIRKLQSGQNMPKTEGVKEKEGVKYKLEGAKMEIETFKSSLVALEEKVCLCDSFDNSFLTSCSLSLPF